MAISMNGAYINGLDNPKTYAETLKKIPGSTTTDFILFSFTVPNSGSADIQFGISGPIVASGGHTRPFVKELQTLVDLGCKEGKCQRVWISVGGADTSTFTNMQKILSGGEPLKSTLEKNFQAIFHAFKTGTRVQSVGFDLDYEENPATLASIVASVTEMLHRVCSCQITFCPFQSENSWIQALQSVHSSLGRQPVVGMNLQCYAGGAGNNPTNWVQALKNAKGTGVTDAASFIWPIQSMDNNVGPTFTPPKMEHNLKTWQSAGGSFWATAALFQSGQKFNWQDYSNAIANGIVKRAGDHFAEPLAESASRRK